MEAPSSTLSPSERDETTQLTSFTQVPALCHGLLSPATLTQDHKLLDAVPPDSYVITTERIDFSGNKPFAHTDLPCPSHEILSGKFTEEPRFFHDGTLSADILSRRNDKKALPLLSPSMPTANGTGAENSRQPTDRM